MNGEYYAKTIKLFNNPEFKKIKKQAKVPAFNF